MMAADKRNPDQGPESHGDELPPRTVLSNGTYSIVQHLKTGGFGITYLATDTLGRRVVIKECFPAGICARSGQSVLPRSRINGSNLAGLIEKFVLEAHSLAKISHANVVKVHQVFKENETAYMALDYVEGHDLLEVMANPALALTPAGVKSTLLKLLDAISAVHEKGLLHRDISPDNILVDSKRNPILIDFGAARDQERTTDSPVSTLHVVKDGYSPQELYLSGGGDQGPWSDLYSLAASFYHVVAGEAPSNSQSRLAAMASNVADPCVPLRGRFDGYDDAFLASIDKAMSVLPKERMQSAHEWTGAILGDNTGKVRRLPIVEPTRQLVTPMTRVTRMEAEAGRKKMGPSVIVGGVLVLALVSTGVYLAMPDSNMATVARLPAEVAETARLEPEAAAPAPNPEPAAAPEPAPDVEAVATAEPAAAAPAAKPAKSDVSAMSSNWTIELPFATTSATSNIVESVTEGTADWLVPGMQVLSVNGTEITSLQDIPGLLHQTQDPGDAPTVTATLSVVTEPGAAPVDKSVDLPVTHRLVLVSGAEFVVRWVNGTWQTEVVALPVNYTGEMRVGDIVVGHVATGTRIDGPNALKNALETALISGTGSTTLAVQQGGQMWVVTFPLPN
jgi:Protein kinase domain